MPAAPLVHRHNEPRASHLFIFQKLLYHFRPDRRLIYERYEDAFNFFGQLLRAERNGDAHLALRIIVDGEAYRKVSEPFMNLFGAMPQDNYNRFDSAAQKIINTGFDYGLVTEGKQRLERAHATGAPGG